MNVCDPQTDGIHFLDQLLVAIELVYFILNICEQFGSLPSFHQIDYLGWNVHSGLHRFYMQRDIQPSKVFLQNFQCSQNEIYSNGRCLMVYPVLIINFDLSMELTCGLTT